MSDYSLSFYNTMIRLEDGDVLLYNSRTNNLVEMSSSEYFGVVSDIQQSALTDNLLMPRLVRYGFVVSSDRDEKGEYLSQFERKKHQSKALSLTIAVTDICNLQCRYCYVEKSHRKTLSHSVEEGILRFIDSLVDDLHPDTLFVTWTGGEPLLALTEILAFSHRLREFCSTRSLDYAANMITNGTLLSLETCEHLRKVGVRGVQISMEPSELDENHSRPSRDGVVGSFEHVYGNVCRIAGHMPVTIRVALSRRNQYAVTGFVRRLHNDGLLSKQVRFAIGHLHVKESSDVGVLADVLDEHEYARSYFDIYAHLFGEGLMERPPFPYLLAGCGAFRDGVFSIDADGYVYKCFEDVFSSTSSIGNVLRDPAVDFTFRHTDWLLRNYDFRGMECIHCKVLPVCNGGCHMMRAFSLQSPVGSYCRYGCNEWKHGLETGLKLYARFARESEQCSTLAEQS